MADPTIPRPRIRRKHAYDIRGAFHEAEKQASSKEKDLSAVACCALWDLNMRKMVCALRRLVGLNAEKWSPVMDLTKSVLAPTWD